MFITDQTANLQNFKKLWPFVRHEQNQFTKCPILNASNFRKYPLKQEQFKNFQALLYKLKDFRSLGFLFPNSRTFKDSQVLYEG
jgi:hypothetical protein